MNRYRCYKEVYAAKIIGIRNDILVNGVQLDFSSGSTQVSLAWADKHEPQIGGYYVVYDDGYTSYSPAKAFEAGYTKC